MDIEGLYRLVFSVVLIDTVFHWSVIVILEVIKQGVVTNYEKTI